MRGSTPGSEDWKKVARGRARGKRRIDPAGKRERILRSAREVFSRKPFEEASVSEIVGLAGVAQGTIDVYAGDSSNADLKSPL